MNFLDGFLAAYHAFESSTLAWVSAIILTYGGLGVLVGMFLESSIVPIPSEAVLIAAGALGLSPITVAIYGAVGSALGAMVGYLIGLKGGRPVVKKFGPWLHITEERFSKAEAFAKKHGTWGVLAARLIPIIPFKVFSIAAGITQVDFVPFVLFTLIGTLPRAFLLAWLGAKIVEVQNGATIAVLAIIAVFVVYWFYKRYRNSKKKQNDE